ncbi:MAG TPA: putative quinol monooxygenase [Candidatus Saccharimonadales bacterium]|jgi:quinol monooxygenase YgiN|nr:putative quinol monooxygenase [Candidatus Saccharimonadales bacterium]
MYGRHGKLLAKPGQRDALVALLLEASRGGAMPGCRLYVVSEIPAEPDAISVLEVWEDKGAHEASLQLESVRSIIAQGRPLIAGMGESVELRPVGGQGLD